MDLKTVKTYIYIDVSNIRYACRRSCDFDIDFVKFYRYLARKYPNAQDIRYYEGISPRDEKRKNHFQFLEKIGYTICPLWRKSYVGPAKYESFDCKKCGTKNKVMVLPSIIKMKSNVDVYLATDMLVQVARAKEPIHVIIVSCDGDYAEAIKGALMLSPKSQVTVMATPMTKAKNCLSARLSQLINELGRSRFRLTSIADIKKYISYNSQQQK